MQTLYLIKGFNEIFLLLTLNWKLFYMKIIFQRWRRFIAYLIQYMRHTILNFSGHEKIIEQIDSRESRKKFQQKNIYCRLVRTKPQRCVWKKSNINFQQFSLIKFKFVVHKISIWENSSLKYPIYLSLDRLLWQMLFGNS